MGQRDLRGHWLVDKVHEEHNGCRGQVLTVDEQLWI
jgi:hypothetical protein